MAKTVFLVIPCYNEEKVLDETSKRVSEKLNFLINTGKISGKSRALFVDDGSKDLTWEIISGLHNQNPLLEGLKLSRNRGHQYALLSGLMVAKNHADAVISMDADLQDDVDVIDKFIDEFLSGSDIVYGVRSSRAKDTFFKKTTAEGFYKIMKSMGVEIVFNHADYRLMSRRSLESLSEYKETNLFLRGIVPLIGFKSTVVEYERHERFAGETKYPLKKMIAFALDGITSFSVKPIRLILSLGIFLFCASLILMIYFLIVCLMGYPVEGWTITVGSMWMLGGVQLICLGVVGEYVGKIYSETKRRPPFIIDRNTLEDNDER